MDGVMEQLKQSNVLRLLHSKIILINIVVLLASWTLLLICVLPIGWYHSSWDHECQNGDTVTIPVTYTLWGMHVCGISTTEACSKTCEYMSWRKYGCGDPIVGDYVVDCWDLDTSGISSGLVLITSLAFSMLALCLCCLRLWDRPVGPLNRFYFAVMNLVCTFIAAILTLFVWCVYPIVVDKSGWEADFPLGSLHLYWGWYLTFFALLMQVAQCVVVGYDTYRTGVRHTYRNLADEEDQQTMPAPF